VTDTRLDEIPKPGLSDTIALPAPHAAQEDLIFLDFLIIVAQHKKLVVLVAAIGALISLLIALLLPDEYTATVIVLPPQGTLFLDSAPSNQAADKKSEDGKARTVPLRRDLNDLYVSILRSRSVEDAVIQRFGLSAEYRKSSPAEARVALERRTKIDGSTRDGLIRLSYSAQDPKRASELANGYIEQFRELSQHLVIPEAARDGYFIQVVDPAVPPEQKSFPNRARITIAGAVAGLSLGIMLALLRGGLVRMQQDPAASAKLGLLKQTILAQRSRRTIDIEGTDASGLRASHGSTTR
jgi:uncharacterized protein involved in exopolysaccharide biosynthesis